MPMMTVGFYMLAVGFNMPMLIVAIQRLPRLVEPDLSPVLLRWPAAVHGRRR